MWVFSQNSSQGENPNSFNCFLFVSNQYYTVSVDDAFPERKKADASSTAEKPERRRRRRGQRRHPKDIPNIADRIPK